MTDLEVAGWLRDIANEIERLPPQSAETACDARLELIRRINQKAFLLERRPDDEPPARGTIRAGYRHEEGFHVELRRRPRRIGPMA